MSIPSDCCTPCPSVPAVNVPGLQGATGAAGADGTNGINAFTLTTSTLVIPSGTSVSVANSSMFGIGQIVLISDGTNIANYVVNSVPTTTSLGVTALGYPGDSTSGTIAIGATVTPAGVKGVDAPTVTAAIDAAVGGTQALNTTPLSQVLSKTLTLSASTGKSYLLFARARFDYVGATFAANQVITFGLYRTNNTPGNVPNASSTLKTAVITTLTYSVGEITLVAIPYTTAGASDIIQPIASISATPSAGSVEVIECNLTAVELT